MTNVINTTINFLQKFSNRELAFAIWLGIALIWAFFHSNIRKSLFHVIKAFLARKVAISYVIMLSYIALIIILLKAVGIWKVTNLPVTLLWVLFVAFVLLLNFSNVNDKNFFIDAIKNNFKVLIVLEFIINLYVFKLWIELILIPVIGIIVMMIAIAETDEEYEIIIKPLNYIMAFIGLILTGYAIYMVVTDLTNFVTLENFSNFHLPILFNFTLLPFVYFFALYVGYDSLFIRLKIFVNDEDVLKYAKKKTILTFKLNLGELNKWSEYIETSCRFKVKNEVDEAIWDFKNAL